MVTKRTRNIIIVLVIAVVVVIIYLLLPLISFILPLPRECRANFFSDSQLSQMNKTMGKIDYLCYLSTDQQRCESRVYYVFTEENDSAYENRTWQYSEVNVPSAGMILVGDMKNICAWKYKD